MWEIPTDTGLEERMSAAKNSIHRMQTLVTAAILGSQR